jgi:hypothetical protein
MIIRPPNQAAGSARCYAISVQVILDIPDEFAEKYLDGKDPARAALEAIAVDAYHNHKLNESQVRRMMGYGTRMQVHSLLKAHDVYLNYGPEELAQDIKASDDLSAQRAARAALVA